MYFHHLNPELIFSFKQTHIPLRSGHVKPEITTNTSQIQHRWLLHNQFARLVYPPLSIARWLISINLHQELQAFCPFYHVFLLYLRQLSAFGKIYRLFRFSDVFLGLLLHRSHYANERRKRNHFRWHNLSWVHLFFYSRSTTHADLGYAQWGEFSDSACIPSSESTYLHWLPENMGKQGIRYVL